MSDDKQLMVIEHEAVALLEQARAFRVVDSATHQEAGERVKALKRFKKERVDGIAGVFVDIQRQAWKAALALQAKIEDPRSEAEKLYSGEMVGWEKAENARLAEENLRLLEQARKDQEERALAEAQRLEKEGRKEEADAVVESAIMTPVFAPPPQVVPKIAGLRDSTVYRCRPKEGLEYMIPREFLMWDEIKTNAHVRQSKGAWKPVWLQVWSETGKGGTGR